MSVLYVDCETFPIEAYTWGLWNQNVSLNQIKKPTQMASFAAKWRGERRTRFHSLHHDGKDQMIQALWDLLDQAQVVVTWNGDKFDLKHFNREFIEAGLTPPSPFKSLDLLKTARGQFYFPSNKLDYVLGALGLEHKVSHEGFGLWTKCMAGDEKAWAKMARYNKRDVTALEEIHNRLMPYIKRGPHMGLLDGREEDSCGNCSGVNLQRRGFAYTPLGVYRQLRCNDCGSWSRGKKAVATADARVSN